MKNKVLNKKDIYTFILIFGIMLIIFRSYLTKHFASDTFEIMHLGYKKYILEYYLKDGRLFTCLLLLMANSINLNVNVLVIISAVLSLVISTQSVIILKNIIIKQNAEAKEYIAILISYGIIFNFMYIENLYFAEAFIMSITILIQIIAAKIFMNKGKKYYIKTNLLIILSITLYQGTISFFPLILTILLLMKYKFNYKKIATDLIKGSITILIGIAFNYIIIKIANEILGTSQNRIGSIFNIIRNAKYIFQYMWSFFVNTYGMFPKGLFITFLVLELLLISFSIKQKEYKHIVNVGIIIIVGVGAAFAPHLITLSSFMTPRLMFNIGALFSCVFMYIYSCTTIVNERKYIGKMLELLLVIYIVVNVTNYSVLLYNQKQGMIEDKKECQQIDKWITEYENKNKIEIKYIAICKDENYTMQYKKGIETSSKFVSSLTRDVLSNVGIINYYTNRNIQRKSMPEEIYNKYFKGKDWDSLEKEQLVFIDDTLYYCFY